MASYMVNPIIIIYAFYALTLCMVLLHDEADTCTSNQRYAERYDLQVYVYTLQIILLDSYNLINAIIYICISQQKFKTRVSRRMSINMVD